MLPRAGCADILPTRSSVSRLAREDEVPDGAKVDGDEYVAGTRGRRGERRDIWRVCEGVDRRCVAAAVPDVRSLRSAQELVEATLRHRKAFIVPPLFSSSVQLENFVFVLLCPSASLSPSFLPQLTCVCV